MPAHRRHDENRCEKVQASMTATTQIELLIGHDTLCLQRFTNVDSVDAY